MNCNKTKQPEFTKEQIAECEKCKHLSERKVWCSNFGVWIYEPDRGNEKKKYPSIITQAGSFGKAAVKQVRAGNPKRTDEETARIICICEACEEYNKKKMRCYACGCYMKNKIPWETTHCKIGKW